MALRVHGAALGVHTDVDTRGICALSQPGRGAQRASPCRRTRPIVGAQRLPPRVGHPPGRRDQVPRDLRGARPGARSATRPAREIVLGKLSGRAGFAARVRALGIELPGDGVLAGLRALPAARRRAPRGARRRPARDLRAGVTRLRGTHVEGAARSIKPSRASQRSGSAWSSVASSAVTRSAAWLARVATSARRLARPRILRQGVAAARRGNLEAAFALLREEVAARPDLPRSTLLFWELALACERAREAAVPMARLVRQRGEPPDAANRRRITGSRWFPRCPTPWSMSRC